MSIKYICCSFSHDISLKENYALLKFNKQFAVWNIDMVSSLILAWKTSSIDKVCNQTNCK